LDFPAIDFLWLYFPSLGGVGGGEEEEEEDFFNFAMMEDSLR
jgi:hypothetical protein